MRSENERRVRSYRAFMITKATPRATSGSKRVIPVRWIRTSPMKTPSEVYTSVRRCHASLSSAMASDCLATFISLRETYQFTSAEIPITAIPKMSSSGLKSSDAGPRSLNRASRMISTAAANIRRASTNPEMSSNFPWPNSCWASGGSADFRTEKYAITAAIRSIDEWIASDMILTEPIENPTTNFMRTSPVLEMTERRAVFALSTSSVVLSIMEGFMNIVYYQHAAYIKV